MTTIKDVLDYLETIAPSHMKMEWDNIGLLCGDPARKVHRILVALDPFETVYQEAYEMDADLIITHHPLIFYPPRSITPQDALGRSILFLCEKGICAINAHTNLDCAPGGVNDVLANTLGLQNIAVIDPMGTDAQGHTWGLLRTGSFEATLPSFLSHVKEKLGTPVLRYVSGGRSVNKVAVGGGACSGELQAVHAAGCDTFVTADVKYNQFWEAKELGINLIDAGHFYTENPICAVLAQKLQVQFPDLTVKVSQTHADCMEFA